MKRCPGCNAPVPEHYTDEMLCVICLRFGVPQDRVEKILKDYRREND